jgi:hypothetical protein
MSFNKISAIEVLGLKSRKGWSKSSARTSSIFMDEGYGIDLESALDSVADTYRISRDPRDYILIPCRACSADRPNENMDAWRREELLRFDPKIGRRVYSTFMLKPHFVNHNASNYALARGVILDSHFNDVNSASDNVKLAVNLATGKDVETDDFIETLIAMDTSKDPALAGAYKDGSVYRFSMGCDVDSTECSVCGRIATNTHQFCEHVRGKQSRREYEVGGHNTRRKGFEWCKGTIFAELSAVDDPADKDAEIQEGILRLASTDPGGKSLTDSEIREITAYVLRHHDTIPESLAGLINSAFIGR